MNATLNELVEFLDKIAGRLDDWQTEADHPRVWDFEQTADEVRRMAAKIRKSVEVDQ